MSTRRKPTSPPSSPSPLAYPPTHLTTTTTTTTTASKPRSPFLPTTLEAVLISLYPLTLLLGSLFSTLSPTNRAAPYNTASQSHPAEFAPSYFARKRNIFNLYFVKIGWFWSTAALALFLMTHPSLGPPLRPLPTPRRLRALLRYAAVTAVWVFVTQWCFGAPLIDRGFLITGGTCRVVLEAADAPAAAARQALDVSRSRELVTAAACRLAGGRWLGGHDVSGHVFLLILGSALLWFEVLPVLTRAGGLRDGRRIMLGDGKVASVAVEKLGEREGEGNGGESGQVTKAGVKVALGVVGLMWWMLLMTAAFFHTWVEKFTGLLVAFSALWVVYFLPRGVPALRAVVGMPGV